MAEFADPSLLSPALRRDLSLRALEALASRFHELELSGMVVYDFDHVPASALPILAEQFGLMDGNGWELAVGEAAQRELLRVAVELHRHKGTPWAIRRVISAAGLGQADIREGLAANFYNGVQTHNGAVKYGDATEWAAYSVTLTTPATAAQVALVRKMLAQVAPARCHLTALNYTPAG